MGRDKGANVNRIARATVLGAIVAVGAPVAGAQQTPAESHRIEISVAARRLWVVTERGDTLRVADIAVGSGDTLTAEDGRTWRFVTPLGRTTVTKKEIAPDWIPPDWHYIERARARNVKVAQLNSDVGVELTDGRRLAARGLLVGIVPLSGEFTALPADGDLIFEGTLYIPPFGTRNRRIPGVLGAFRLQLANGIGLHGTRDTASVGRAASHGCIRLRDDDIAWLHAHIPVGTRVIIR